MTISLIKEDSRTISEIQNLASQMLNSSVILAERFGNGSNSRVFRLLCTDSKQYVAKFYFHHPTDPRDRLNIEYSSFSFLKAQGITNVPHPIILNQEESCAIYEFIEGEKISSESVTAETITSAVDFLVKLKELKKNPQSQNLPPASEACFSIQAIIDNILERLNRLYKLPEETEGYGEFKSFLISGIRPFLNILREWVHRRAVQLHIPFNTEIPFGQRTLSPSDFGFHNAVRDKNGRIVFFDFEYFGWDDPAKLICDFLLHPAMTLSDEIKKTFILAMAESFKENEQLIKRVALIYPFLGIKWCLIFLNEFIPDDFSRRLYAAGGPLDRASVRQEQLLKARNLYRRIKETYQDFPYQKGHKWL